MVVVVAFGLDVANSSEPVVLYYLNERSAVAYMEIVRLENFDYY